MNKNVLLCFVTLVLIFQSMGWLSDVYACNLLAVVPLYWLMSIRRHVQRRRDARLLGVEE